MMSIIESISQFVVPIYILVCIAIELVLIAKLLDKGV